MARDYIKGIPVSRWTGRPAYPSRTGQRASTRECWRYSWRKHWLILWHWVPWAGWYLHATYDGRTESRPLVDTHALSLEDQMKRKIVTAGAGVIMPRLSETSLLLAKLPAIREFLTQTAYEDNTSRQPGYLTLRNKGHAFELTLYDWDGGCRLPLLDSTFDKVLLGMEALLGLEDAPWAVDKYLMEMLAKKTKRK